MKKGKIEKTSIEKKIEESTKFLKKSLGRYSFPSSLIILGSGFKGFADDVKRTCTIKLCEIPHFFVPSVQGHGGELIIGESGGRQVAILSGRVHMYEGFSATEVVYAIRALSRFGLKTVLLTNAAGSLRQDFKPGETIAIKDHINLTGKNCLIDKEAHVFGPTFLDMASCYNAELRKEIVKKLNIKEGVYVGVLGPTFETPSESTLFGKLGGDMIGMSTVQETIAAHQLGLKVAGLSLITNYSGATHSEKLCHQEVLDLAKASTPKLIKQLSTIIGVLAS